MAHHFHIETVCNNRRPNRDGAFSTKQAADLALQIVERDEYEWRKSWGRTLAQREHEATIATVLEINEDDSELRHIQGMQALNSQPWSAAVVRCDLPRKLCTAWLEATNG